MAENEPSYDNFPLPTLLRRARATYGHAMRTALAAAGFDDIPVNGLYALGRLDMDGSGLPMGQLIEGLGISKQTAGQLVDNLVSRGYLNRYPDAADRRKLNVSLTERGIAAAQAQRAGRADIDRMLAEMVGEENVQRTRQALVALIEIGIQQREEAGDGPVGDAVLKNRA